MADSYRPIRMQFTLVIQLWLLWLAASAAGGSCPEQCTCSTGDAQVACKGLGLVRIPNSLPASLSTLDLTQNAIRRVSIESLVPIRGVVNLKLKENEIEEIEEGAFHVTDSLQTLDLSHNRLHMVHQATFSGAENLLHLDLSYNMLDKVDGAFARMGKLTRLDLQNNRIQELTQFTFRDLVSLRQLRLSANRIKTIERRAFTNLERLMYLLLKSNPLVNADNMEFSSNLLSYVDISECGLRYIPRGLPNSIRYLQLRRNNMTAITKRDFYTCQYISILVLDENGLQHVEDGTFALMGNLQQLWLNGNKLHRVPHPLPASLRRLLMDSNQLGVITNEFPESSQLNTLSLMGNNITYISPDAFHNLGQLTSLDLSNNQIQNVYSDTFVNTSKLGILQLAKNPLRYFYSRCFHGLRSLRTLTLAYDPNNVTMAEDVFEDLVRLKKLDLDSSPGLVRRIFSSQRLISGLQAVEDMSMQSTDLTHVPRDFPNFFPNLLIFHLTSTRWHCDRSMVWFKDWLQNTNVRIEKKFEIVCFTPRILHGRPIAKLEDADFIPTTSTQRTTTLKQLFPPVPSPSSPPRTSRHQNHNDVLPSELVTPGGPNNNGNNNNNWQGGPFHTSADGGFSFDGEPTNDPFRFGEASGYGHEDEEEEVWEEVFGGRNNNGGNGSPEGDAHRAPATPSAASAAERPPHGKPPWSSSSLPFGYENENNYNNHRDSDSVVIRTLPKHTTQFPGQFVPAGGETANRSDQDNSSNDDDKFGPGSLLVIIAATVSALVFLALIVTGVVVAVKRHNAKKEVYHNAIKYQQRNDVLYFMPQGQTAADGVQATVVHGPHTPTESVPTTSTSREQMQLVPGRDINHEGPLRVYKWEDF